MNQSFVDIIEVVVTMIFNHFLNKEEYNMDEVVKLSYSYEDAFVNAVAYSIYRSIIGSLDIFTKIKKLRKNPEDAYNVMNDDIIIDFMCAYEAKIKGQTVVEEKKEEKKEEVVEEKKEEIVEEKKEEIVEENNEEIAEEENEEITEEENEEIAEDDMEEDRVVLHNVFTNTRQPNGMNVPETIPDPFYQKPLQVKKPIAGRKPRGVSPMLNQKPKIENVVPFPLVIPNNIKPIETFPSACGIPVIPPQNQTYNESDNSDNSDYSDLADITGINMNDSPREIHKIRHIQFKKVYAYLYGEKLIKKDLTCELPTETQTSFNTVQFKNYFYNPEYFEPYENGSYLFRLIKN